MLSTGGVQLCAPPQHSWPGLLRPLPPPLPLPTLPAHAFATAESNAKQWRKPAWDRTRWEDCHLLTLLSQRSMVPCLHAAADIGDQHEHTSAVKQWKQGVCASLYHA
jgi:hypothetical protein